MDVTEILFRQFLAILKVLDQTFVLIYWEQSEGLRDCQETIISTFVYLSIFSGLAALMSADIARNLYHWSVAVLTVTDHFIYSHF